MTEKPITAQELEELFGNLDFEQIVKDELVAEFKAELKKHEDKYLTDILIHPEVYKYYTRKQYKKIKRRIFYEVIWWSAESRLTKCFYSAQKMRKFVNELHSWYNDYIEIEKTWSYRDFTPRHKTHYVSFRPNQFVCVEKY